MITRGDPIQSTREESISSNRNYLARPRSGSLRKDYIIPKVGYAAVFQALFRAKFEKAEREGDYVLRQYQDNEVAKRTQIEVTTVRKFIREDYPYNDARPLFWVLANLAKFFGDLIVDQDKNPIEWDERKGRYKVADQGYRVTVLDLMRHFRYRTFDTVTAELGNIQLGDESERRYLRTALDIARSPLFMAKPSKWLNRSAEYLASNDDLIKILHGVAFCVASYLADADRYGNYDSFSEHLLSRVDALS